jgi:sporulation protein YlmC with PRC-barrel domain
MRAVAQAEESEEGSTMTNDTLQFTIGSDVRCGAKICGQLRRVVIEPIDRVVTHLVVEPEHGRATGRLVPVGQVSSVTADRIELGCTVAEFDEIEGAEESHFVPGGPGGWTYDQGQMLSWPHYATGLHIGTGLGPGGGGLGVMTTVPPGPRMITLDRVPVGEVQVRRGQHVHAVDGTIGQVKGLVIDRDDHHVTHILLGEGHLWGHKSVAVPIAAVADVLDGVRINLTKDQVRDLPAIDLDEQGWLDSTEKGVVG